VEKRVLPKVGDKVSADQFFISKTNMRADEPFGETEEDQALIGHFRRTDVVQPFKARPEDKEGHWEPGMDLSLAVGYGVYVGGRRFRAMREVGKKDFTVGQHCWIEEASDGEAMEASLKENLEEFRSNPDPITRAKAINSYLSRLPTGLRGLGRAWGIAESSLSEYLTILRLNPAMQEVVQKRLISFRDALATARLGLGDELQTKLAEIVHSQGVDAFKRELARLMAGKGKRGIPAGVYEIARVIWDKRNRKEMGHLETVTKAAEKREMTVPEYIKDFIVRHIDEIEREIA